MTRNHTPFSRRQFFGGAAALAGSAALAGCGMTAGGGGSGSGSKKFTFLNDNAVKGTPMEDAINAFQKESGIEITVQPIPAEYDTKFRTVLASGAPPDLVKINDDYVKGISETGALLDLRDLIKQEKIDTSKFQPTLYNLPRQDNGEHTAWVIGHSPRLIVYNVDMFQKAGVDLPPTTWTSDGWTWDDFIQAAKKLTIKGKHYGALIYYDTGFEQTFSVNNGDADGIYSADGKKFLLASPKGVEAVQWATDLTCKEHVQPPWGELQGDEPDLQMFGQGRLAMFFTQFSTVPYLQQAAKNVSWDVAPVPAGPAGQITESSVVVYAIPKKAKNPEAAFKFLTYLTSKKGGELFAKGKMFLPMDKDALAVLTGPPQHIDLFKEAVAHSTLPHQTDDTLGARNLYRPALEKVYNCEKQASDVLPALRTQVENILAKK